MNCSIHRTSYIVHRRSNIVCVIILLTFSSCYSPRYIYSPPTQNIPLLNKKGNSKLGGYFTAGGGSANFAYTSIKNYNKGIDLHMAYALSDHFGIMINKYNRWEKNNGANDFNTGDSAVIKYRRGLIEFAAGYFTSLKRGRNTSFQVFAGMASGKFSLKENSANNGTRFTRFHNNNITKLFLQPAITVGQQKNFAASFSSRFNAVFYKNLKTDYSSSELNNYLLNDLSVSPVFFWEPSMNYSFAFKKLKAIRFDFQAGFAILINKRFVDYRTINFAFGLVSNPDIIKKKKKKQLESKN